MTQQGSVTYRQMVSGSAWMIAMRWSIRAIGVLSTAILARLLAPEDFGLVAMGTMVIGLIHTFSELGTARLLIRMEKPDRSHYDTAWTIILLQSVLIAALLVVSAPLAARYFDEPRVVPVIRWLAVSSVISGLGNIGIINLRKDLEFQRDFLYGLCCKISLVASTIPLALYLRSYWALVAGAITSEAASVILTYLFHDYRPRPSFSRWREFVRFSMWITPSNIVSFFIQRLDAFIIGAVTTASQLGLYHFASEVSKMATNEIIVPMGRALYPSYAKLVHDRKKLAGAFLNVVRTVAIVCCAVGPGLAVVSDDFVHVLLGDQWVFSIPLVRFLAITGALASIVFVLRDQIFIVTGNEKFSFWLLVIQLAIAAPALVVVGRHFGVVELAATTTVLSAVFVLIAAANVKRAVPISFSEILMTLMRPVASAVVMVLVVRLLHWGAFGLRPLSLAFDVTVGAITYTSTLLGLWKLAGQPAGPEKAVLEYLVTQVSARWRRWRSRQPAPASSTGGTDRLA